MSKEKADYQQWIKEKTAKFIEDLELPTGDNKNIIISCLFLIRQRFIYLAQYEKSETIELFMNHIRLWGAEPESEAYSDYIFIFGNECRRMNKANIAHERVVAIEGIKILLHCKPAYKDDLIALGIPIDKSNGSLIFETIAYHSSLLVEFIIATVQSLSEGVTKEYQTKLFSYTALIDAMCATHFPARDGVAQNALMILDLAQNTMLAAFKQSRSRCVNHILDLIRLCYHSRDTAAYEDLKLGVPEGVLEDVSLINSIVHDPAIYSDYLPDGCSEEEIKSCHSQVSKIIAKALQAAEAECTADLTDELINHYKVVKRSAVLAGLFSAMPEQSELEKKDSQQSESEQSQLEQSAPEAKAAPRKTTISFAC
jgi:hypothetical protein